MAVDASIRLILSDIMWVELEGLNLNPSQYVPDAPVSCMMTVVMASSFVESSLSIPCGEVKFLVAYEVMVCAL